MRCPPTVKNVSESVKRSLDIFSFTPPFFGHHYFSSCHDAKQSQHRNIFSYHSNSADETTMLHLTRFHLYMHNNAHKNRK